MGQADIQGRIFIVSSPRSGTTLLQSLLSAHPLIHSFPETHFFPKTMGEGWRRYLGLPSPTARRGVSDFLEMMDVEGREKPVLGNGIWARQYARVFAARLDEITLGMGKRIWVEKTPRHLHFIREIKRYIPGAKFIHLIRRDRDVVASLYEVSKKYPEVWGEPRSIDQCIQRWVSDTRITFNHAHDPRHHLVSYENLTEDPRIELRELCHFIGIPFEEKMLLEYGEAAERVVAPGEEWKSGIGSPIRNANSGKFLEVFSEEEQRFVLNRLPPVVENPEVQALFLPDFSLKNPYQRELARALGRHGVRVSFGGISRFLPVLRAIRANWRPDILHLHWTHDFIVAGNSIRTFLKGSVFILEILLAKLLGIRVVWTVHNLLEHEKNQPELELFFQRLVVWLYDQLIVHCWFARDLVIEECHLIDRRRSRIHVIPHGHYLDSYENREGRREARSRMGLGEEEVVFLHFGQMRPYKGLAGLVEAFGRLAAPELRLILAGQPANGLIHTEALGWCESDDRILPFLGFVPEEDIQLFFNAADVVVLPFTEIMTSGSALLAMSFGKPLVVPDIGCIGEVVDRQACFLYDPDEVGGLKRALAEASRADLSSMGERNLERVRRFDWDEIGERTRDVYRLCGGTRD